MRRGFTMIELIFSLIIVSIISLIGTDVIRSVYESYVFSKEVERTQNDLRRTLDLIAARLSYRIKNSTVGIDQNGSEVLGVGDPRLVGGEHQTLAWVAKAYELQRDGNGGWSGYLLETGSDENKINATSFMSDFSGLEHVEDMRLIFAGDNRRGTMIGGFEESWGYGGTGNYSYYKFTKDEENLTITPEDIDISAARSDEYYLASSAYALKVIDEDLMLYYNFRPWLGEKITDANITKSKLLENVKVLQFVEMGGVLRLSICINPPKDSELRESEFCRERSIF